MKQCLFIALTIALLCITQAQAGDNQLSKQEIADGWVLLFDGKDLSQWRNFKQSDISPLWQVQDGAIHLTKKGGGDILTKQQFQNFSLKLDWKIIEAGNSGIFILADENGKRIYSHAPEIQILDNERHSDNLVDSHLSGSLYDLVASPAVSHKPAGQWNQVEISLKDNHLLVKQNDIVTVSIVIGSSTWNTLVAGSKFATWQGFGVNKAGHIGLQDHDDKVWFKNIKIKEH
ncbi:3-keto-disaccharide hydrolase [Thalassotalea agarivorans]|uniref:3-keto-alpha-glucoside-1,2-lyase/3-keto-2-hydroxy-glucal hydratase domain-containing protein n=1 Tax=Thalassotalea agarivorans TaxID=349064 RepID=A0A1H9Y7W8_THASX|nr:DUF1080 domain-containing protein [Thalassotalea agarivorans]SES64905.1 protein of unknown function [Thalassotalea agarivorans]